MKLKGNKVLILGLGKSGIAAALTLSKMGAKVVASDIKEERELKDIEILSSHDIELVCGGHPLDLLENCKLIVVSPGIPNDLEIIIEAKNRNIPVVSELELGYWFTKAPVIAITGTNGKTTTTTLVGEILKNDGFNISLAGNIGIPLIGEMESRDNNDYIVVEVSSFQLENILHFKPKIGVILNISEDHMNRHKNLENYIEAKARIFENQDESDFLILNYDDPVLSKLAKRAKSNVIFFSRKAELSSGAYVKDDVIVFKYDGQVHPVLKVAELGIKGLHNLENALAAICVACIAKVNLNSLAETLKDFQGVEHRLEYVGTIDGVRYFNDSKGTNPDASQKAIEAIEEPIVLIAGGYDKKTDFTDFIKSFDNKVKKLILLGETADIIAKTAQGLGFYNIEKVDTIEDAVYAAKESAKSGDVVLLSPACASWDMFESFEERGKVFKEAVFSLIG